MDTVRRSSATSDLLNAGEKSIRMKMEIGAKSKTIKYLGSIKNIRYQAIRAKGSAGIGPSN